MTQQDESTQPESAENTPTRFVSAGEVRFAYRRFGNPSGTPLVFLQHFRGSMDNCRVWPRQARSRQPGLKRAKAIFLE